MFVWILSFLVIAIIAAILGFGGLVGVAVGFVKILFWIFMALFITGIIIGNIGRRKLHSRQNHKWNFYSKN